MSALSATIASGAAATTLVPTTSLLLALTQRVKRLEQRVDLLSEGLRWHTLCHHHCVAMEAAPSGTGPAVDAHGALFMEAMAELTTLVESLARLPKGSQVERETLARYPALAKAAATAAGGLRAIMDDAQFPSLSLEEAQAIAEPMVW